MRHLVLSFLKTSLFISIFGSQVLAQEKMGKNIINIEGVKAQKILKVLEEIDTKSIKDSNSKNYSIPELNCSFHPEFTYEHPGKFDHQCSLAKINTPQKAKALMDALRNAGIEGSAGAGTHWMMLKNLNCHIFTHKVGAKKYFCSVIDNS